MPGKSTWFAKRLGELREAAGLSQYALARRSGISKQAVSNLELGAREPSWLTVQLLSAALGVDCREFMDPALTLPEDRPARPRGRPRQQGRSEGATQAPPPAGEPEAVEGRPAKRREGQHRRGK